MLHLLRPNMNLSGFIGTSIKFSTSFIATPTDKAIAGTIDFPNPCKVPLIVCSKTINIIEMALICNTNTPLL